MVNTGMHLLIDFRITLAVHVSIEVNLCAQITDVIKGKLVLIRRDFHLQ